MKGSLRATGNLLVVDLGEVRRLVTESGPRLARYVAVVRSEKVRACTRAGTNRFGPLLLRHGLPPGETVVYTTTADTLDFEVVGRTVRVGGVAIYPEGAPEWVETPYYVWVEGADDEQGTA
ncbi:hypothetical protein ACMC9I_01985 [Deinococcota bacterium DY0809b]